MTFDKLNSISPAGLCDFLDVIGFSHYTERLFAQGVSGADLVACDEFDLSRLGFSFRPHRLKMMQVLDKFRGQSTDTFRRTLTKTIIDSTLKNPLRTTPVSDGYELKISRKISKAKLAEMARATAAAHMTEMIQSKNAEQAAMEQAKIWKRMESIGELYRAAKEALSNFNARTASNELLQRRFHEGLLAESRDEAAEEAASAEQHYADRKRIRDQSREQNHRADAQFAAARLQAALARAKRTSTSTAQAE